MKSLSGPVYKSAGEVNVTSIKKSSPENSQTNSVYDDFDHDSRKKSKVTFLVMFFLFFLFALVIGGIGYYLYSGYVNDKDKLVALTTSQINNLTDITNNYSTIVRLHSDDFKQDPSKETQVLGENSETQNLEGMVKGLENDPSIQNARKRAEVYKESLQKLEKVQQNNDEIESLLTNSLILSKISKYSNPPIQETQEFINITEPTLTFLQQQEFLGIKAVTTGFEFGIALVTALQNAPNQNSFAALDEKIETLRTLREEAKAVDLTGVDQETITLHQDSIEQYGKDMQSFEEMVAYLKFGDYESLERELTDLMTKVVADSTTSETKIISFWQNNKTIRSIDKILMLWKDYEAGISY